MPAMDPLPAPYMVWMRKRKPERVIAARSTKLSSAAMYVGEKSISWMGAVIAAFGTGCSSSDSIDAMIPGLPDPPYVALYFTPFHCAGLWLDVIMTPPAALRSRTAKESSGVGVILLESCTGMPAR